MIRRKWTQFGHRSSPVLANEATADGLPAALEALRATRVGSARSGSVVSATCAAGIAVLISPRARAFKANRTWITQAGASWEFSSSPLRDLAQASKIRDFTTSPIVRRELAINS